MANWKQSNSVITTSGINLLSKAQIGLGTIEITRVIARDVESTAEENKIYTMENIPESSVKQSGIIINADTRDEVSHITARFSNEKLGEEVTFTIKQVIVLARLLDTTGNEIEQETPYFVLQSEDGGDIMPPKVDTPASFDYHLSIVHTGVATVNITIQPSGFVSQEEFEGYKSDVLTDKINILVRLNNNENAEVGQKTENLVFKPWTYSYDEERTWSRKRSQIEEFTAQKGSERFNVDNENNDPSGDLDPDGATTGCSSLGLMSHAEGKNNLTYSANSHVEGSDNYIGFPSDFTTGDVTQYADWSADNSHVEGSENTAVRYKNQHVEGNSNYSEGEYNHTEGNKNINKSTNTHVQGFRNKVFLSHNSFVGGEQNELTQGRNTFVFGDNNSLTKSTSSIVCGYSHNCNDTRQVAIFGSDSVMVDVESVSTCGNRNQLYHTSNSSVFGNGNRVEDSSNSFVCGDHLTVKNAANKTVLGKYCPSDIANRYALIIGGGSEESRRRIFNVDWSGNIELTGSINTGSADLAEYFEWSDMNKDNEDRTGLFVTLNEDKIELANSFSSYVLGCVSASPCLVGNSPSEWSKKYKTDVFGRIEYKTVESILKDGTKELIKVPVLNPDFKEEEYIPRSERPEWSAVALHGRVVVVDDGTCNPNGYCKPYKNGVATKSENGFRVLKRIDDTHILVWIENAVKF